ncbi:hypothetical protein N9948_01375 [bacterium]|nr:hypothetical protein [bacterium]
MADEKTKKEENVETEEKLEWEKSYNLGTAQNFLPLLKSILLLVEEEKKRTIKKVEEAKQLLATMKQNKK